MPRWFVDPAQAALAGDDGVCLASVELPDITVNALEIQEAIILDTIIHDLIVGLSRHRISTRMKYHMPPRSCLVASKISFQNFIRFLIILNLSTHT